MDCLLYVLSKRGLCYLLIEIEAIGPLSSNKNSVYVHYLAKSFNSSYA